MGKIREEMEKVARENAIKELKELQIDIGSSPDDLDNSPDDLDNSPLYYALDIAIQALEQQPRQGHWIKTGDYYTGAYECLDYFECSCCHEESLEEGDYCPNCGAKMEVEE